MDEVEEAVVAAAHGRRSAETAVGFDMFTVCGSLDYVVLLMNSNEFTGVSFGAPPGTSSSLFAIRHSLFARGSGRGSWLNGEAGEWRLCTPLPRYPVKS